MIERTIRVCPYSNCRWEYEEPPLEPDRSLTVEGNLRRHVDVVEDAIRAHLDSAHPGWTLRDVEREAIQAQVRAVFNADPFGPTVPRFRP